tara:strand:- start:2776 stop:3045 length:270 start_codon:yes stop_codon:yes gene_type:complete
MKDEDRVYEFRLEYLSGNSVGHNYHYYLAQNAEKALSYQLEMMDHKHWNIQIIKLERKCPYGNKWIDESEVLKKTNEIKDMISNREKKA